MPFNESNLSFDTALIEMAMQLASERGWHGFTLVEAALKADLPLEDVKIRYPFKSFILLRLNNMVDKAMLCGTTSYPSLKEGLFDLFMRRFDAFQDYRDGLRAVMRALPQDPALAVFLSTATLNTIKWIADAAGLDRHGLRGIMRLQALLAIWTHALRAWEKDATAELSETMKALDEALNKTERFRILKSIPDERLSSSHKSGGLPDYKQNEDSFTSEF
ncbi:TetR family transcriptional regulator [Aristophania vespae]|uniref:TetR family transcriptional regulator n=1 Tax=Aristophania vespae TaxID=2697033 RepID=A0A6P1NEN5_9PROT|nr:TetR family transcriptional regulator [Aristophania vespae]QHI94944.1 TetR family transcriptional regulator [Aristophania vespae]QHI96291.1 TetR family transcriptional regulator [Aristophania vespae]